MSTEAEVIAAEERARTAAQILEHPMVQEALESIRTKAFAHLENTSYADTPEREGIYHLLVARGQFIAFFRDAVTKGKHARLTFNQQQSKQVR